jgi:CMP/dCMP kinase
VTNSAPSTAPSAASGTQAGPGPSGGADGWAAGLVIAVDGPAGSGKSSAARGVARQLGLRYLDTGAMYRALTWWLLEHGVDVADPPAVLARFRQPALEIGTDPAAEAITMDGQDVAGPIRTRQVSNAVSAVAALPEVRQYLIGRQQQIVAAAVTDGPGIVAEGRDIGTVVAPDADVKVFLTASETVRARRRSADLTADPQATAEVTRREQARRDQRDAAQMARAGDAVEIDTSGLELDQVIAEIIDLDRSRAVPRG